MVGTQTVRDLGLKKFIDRKDNMYSVKNASRDKMSIIGSIHLWLHIDGAPNPRCMHFIVSDDVTDMLVGCSNLILLQIIPTNFPAYLHAKKVLRAKADAEDEEEKQAIDKEGRYNFEQVPYEEVRSTLTEFSNVFWNKLSKKTRLKAPPMRIEM